MKGCAGASRRMGGAGNGVVALVLGGIEAFLDRPPHGGRFH